MNDCVWQRERAHWVCLTCGAVAGAPRNPRCDGPGRVVVQQSKCVHLGEATGEIKVACGCDGGDRPTPTHVCERYGRCLPLYAPSGERLAAWKLRQPEASLYALCAGCVSYRTQ